MKQARQIIFVTNNSYLLRIVVAGYGWLAGYINTLVLSMVTLAITVKLSNSLIALVCSATVRKRRC